MEMLCCLRTRRSTRQRQQARLTTAAKLMKAVCPGPRFMKWVPITAAG